MIAIIFSLLGLLISTNSTPTTLQQPPNKFTPTIGRITQNTEGLNTYTNQDIGISFQYPQNNKLFEHYYQKQLLFAVKLFDQNENLLDITLAPTNEDTLRTCEDILTNGFNGGDYTPSQCESIVVDSRPMRVLTFGRDELPGEESHQLFLDSRHIQFQSQQGVLEFSTATKNLYDDLLILAKSVKYL